MQLVPLSFLSEQTAVVRFLDHATDRIERCIRTKEKLIMLLEEQKQVIIHESVTGRIDVRTGKPYSAYVARCPGIRDAEKDTGQC